MKGVPSIAVVVPLTASAVIGLGSPSCNCTSVSVNGAAVYAVVLGTAHLTVDCTVAGMDAAGLTGVGTASYYQVGTCTAILCAEEGGKATATASVVSSGV